MALITGYVLPPDSVAVPIRVMFKALGTFSDGVTLTPNGFTFDYNLTPSGELPPKLQLAGVGGYSVYVMFRGDSCPIWSLVGSITIGMGTTYNLAELLSV